MISVTRLSSFFPRSISDESCLQTKVYDRREKVQRKLDHKETTQENELRKKAQQFLLQVHCACTAVCIHSHNN